MRNDGDVLIGSNKYTFLKTYICYIFKIILLHALYKFNSHLPNLSAIELLGGQEQT